MTAWSERTLGELCVLRAGIVFKPADQGLEFGDVPFIKVSDMNLASNAIAIREANNWVNDDYVARVRAKPFPAGTTVFAKIGEALRQNRVRKIVRATLVDNNMMGAIPNLSVVLPEFLYYRLASFDIASTATGTALPYLTVSTLERQRFRIPPRSLQRRIASILSAYDDLIENNTRRIAILEEMARRVYEEWFVRFRFPGHEGAQLVEAELGLVPEGWRTDVLAGVCEPKTGIQTGPFGSQLHKADYSEVGVPVLMPKDLIGFRIEADGVARVPESTAESLKRHRMRPGDIAYGRRGDIGRRAFIMAHQTGWLCGTGCLRIRPDAKKINGWYVFNYLGQDSVVGQIAGRAHGVTMPNLNAKLLESVPVVCPPRELQDKFEQISFPMAELRESLIAKNANLRTTRDLLLPKLISGELDVSAMPEPEALAA